MSDERPCRPCQDDDHDRCLHPDPLDLLVGGCCCDGLDRSDGRDP